MLSRMVVATAVAVVLAPAMAAGAPRVGPAPRVDLAQLSARVAQLPPAASISLAAKLSVLRKGGIVVRDLPVPRRVSPAKPVDGDVSLNFANAAMVSAQFDAAILTDPQQIAAVNFTAVPGATYLVDCEVPSNPSATKVDVLIDDGTWAGTTIADHHLIYAVPPVPPGANVMHAFLLHSPTGSFFLRACEVTRVKN